MTSAGEAGLAATHGERDERALFKRSAQGDTLARATLVTTYLPLARGLAVRYRGGDHVDDLMQVATEGLLKAIDRFDSGRSTHFMAYAVPVIIGELKRHRRDRCWPVHIPRRLKELCSRVERAATVLGPSASVPALAAWVGATPEEVVEARAAVASASVLSLDYEVCDDDDGGGQRLADTLGADDSQLVAAEATAMAERLLREVSPLERDALRLRFAEDLTRSEIGARLGVSRMHVSRLLSRSIARMRVYDAGG